MQKAVLHRKEATAEEFRFFRLWLVVSLQKKNWSSEPILIKKKKKEKKKKKKNMSKKDDGKTFCCYNGMQ